MSEGHDSHRYTLIRITKTLLLLLLLLLLLCQLNRSKESNVKFYFVLGIITRKQITFKATDAVSLFSTSDSRL